MFETPGGTLSLSIGICSFVYEEPREAKPVVREEAESTTVSALSYSFRQTRYFVFYELREPSLKADLPGGVRFEPDTSVDGANTCFLALLFFARLQLLREETLARCSMKSLGFFAV